MVTGAASFCCLGYALNSFIRNDDAALPTTQALLLPRYFISGVFVAVTVLPHWLADVSAIFPVRHLADALLVGRQPDPAGRRPTRKRTVGGCMGPGTWVRNILAGAAIAGLACSAAAIGAGPADAGTVPVVYSAHADGWHGYVRPAAIYFGQGGAPFLAKLHWSSWTGTSARATGELWAQKPGCSLPSYKCPYSSRWAGVYLTTIRWHHGTRYFARMAVRFWYGGKWRWDVGWLQHGYWAFPLVYPYL